ncbi:hypothetical protein JST97_03115 [bacterium]|nr:hypothetical protein [bacterium]
MKNLVRFLSIILFSAVAWAAMDNTFVSGNFSSKAETYTAKDVVIAFWPRLGGLENCLEINLFATKLSAADRKAFIDYLPQQKPDDFRNLMDSKNAPSKPSFLKGARLILRFCYSTSPSDFGNAKIWNNMTSLYLPDGGFEGAAVPVGAGMGSGGSNMGEGLTLKLTGQNRAGELINFQSRYAPRKPDSMMIRPYELQAISPLVVVQPSKG